MQNISYGTVMKILKKETKQFRQPIVTDIAENKRDAFQVLISCVLSLRTRDQTTLEAYKRLFKKAPTPQKILTLSDKELEELIYPVGFYRTKAQNIKKISKIILEKYNGEVPQTMEQLLELPNVGRKTANITLVYGLHKEGLPIDIHCHRIPNRLGWIKTKTPDETEMVLRKQLPKKYWHDFNDLIVIWGQNVCLPISPKCSQCKVKPYCKRIGVKKSR